MRSCAVGVGFWLAGAASACLWDSDTLDAEIQGKLTLQNAIAGRIDRNPPEYYERRRQIAAELIASDPSNLAVYDNAAVACDRLGLHDEGLKWLAKKRRVLKESDTDALYKTLANEGTIRFHRWMAASRPADRIADARLARDQIAEAIRINPEAHFGREPIQLLAMDWVLENAMGPLQEWDSDLSVFINSRSQIPRGERQDGLIGLMMLGNAWESVDILYALADSVSMRDASIRNLIRLRIEELEDQGKSSLTGRSIAEKVTSSTLGTQHRLAERAFVGMRENAKRHQVLRSKFILARLAEGKHPDTHHDFWQGYRGLRPYVVPGPGFWDAIKVRFDNPNYVSNLLCPVAVFAVVAVIGAHVWKTHREKGRKVRPPIQT